MFCYVFDIYIFNPFISILFDREKGNRDSLGTSNPPLKQGEKQTVKKDLQIQTRSSGNGRRTRVSSRTSIPPLKQTEKKIQTRSSSREKGNRDSPGTSGKGEGTQVSRGTSNQPLKQKEKKYEEDIESYETEDDEKKSKTFKCGFEGCEKSYNTKNGLSKHKSNVHIDMQRMWRRILYK